MKNKILFLSLLVSILFLSLISASDWNTYGRIAGSSQAQYGSIGKFDSGIYNATMLNGIGWIGNITWQYFSPLQPLVLRLNFTEGIFHDYLVIPSNTYIQVYDSTLNLVSEISTGSRFTSQIDIMDFWNDSSVNDIVGLFFLNDSDISFRVFSYNWTSYSFNKSFEQNFSFTENNYPLISDTRIATGIKHSGDIAYFSYLINNSGSNWTRFVNITKDSYSYFDFKSPNYFVEPISIIDFNNDGKQEFMMHGEKVLDIFQEDGTKVLEYNSSGSIRDARFFRSDLTSNLRVAILESIGTNVQLNAIKSDGTTLSSFPVGLKSTGGSSFFGGRIAIDDTLSSGTSFGFWSWFWGFNYSVPYHDLYVSTYEWTGSIANITFYVVNGNNGNILYRGSHNWSGILGNTWTHSLTIADLNGDSKNDFIYSHQKGVLIYNPFNDVWYVKDSYTGTGTPVTGFLFSCVPADINADGFQEVICSGLNKTIIYSSTYVNQNPIISTITFYPSTTIQLTQNLFMTISATDLEGNQIYYSHKCSDSDSFSMENFTVTRVCVYSDLGYHNVTLRVRDIYHTNYSSYSTQILVTSTGTTCNNNGICEASLGEDSVSCPNDCVSVPSTNYSFVANGSAIPIDIVNMEDTNQGLLPEIYYGLLGFFSYTLAPLIVLIFLIFFVLIILAFGSIIKNIGKKVSDLGR